MYLLQMMFWIHSSVTTILQKWWNIGSHLYLYEYFLFFPQPLIEISITDQIKIHAIEQNNISENYLIDKRKTLLCHEDHVSCMNKNGTACPFLYSLLLESQNWNFT